MHIFVFIFCTKIINWLYLWQYRTCAFFLNFKKFQMILFTFNKTIIIFIVRLKLSQNTNNISFGVGKCPVTSRTHISCMTISLWHSYLRREWYWMIDNREEMTTWTKKTQSKQKCEYQHLRDKAFFMSNLMSIRMIFGHTFRNAWHW